MAIENGTANNPADLLAKLATFAQANGWNTSAITGGTGFTSPDGATFALTPAAATLEVRGSVGLDGSKTAAQQPNASSFGAQSNNIAGPYAGYSFFAGSEAGAPYLHGVIEASAGIFKPFALGRLVRFDSTPGGEYASAVNWAYSDASTNYPDSVAHEYLFDSVHTPATTSGHVRADLDGKAKNWMPFSPAWTGNRSIGSARTGGIMASFVNIGYQRYNKLGPLVPIYVFGDRPANMRSVLGYVPHLRLVNMRLYAPKQIVTIGGEDWQMFPAHQRSDTSNVFQSTSPSSAYYGYAFKVVA